MSLPPKPATREGPVRLWRYMQMFRRDILSAQPARLFGARMAEFRTPFFRSVLVNEPDLLDEILLRRPDAFPKSDRIGHGLRPLLGESVFLTNGETWRRQRRIIDPAFEGGRLRDTFPAMLAAGRACVDRLGQGGEINAEEVTSAVAADVIFRTLFSVPIDDQTATDTYAAFRGYQRGQPLVNLRALLPRLTWLPSLYPRQTKRRAGRIRALILRLTEKRQAELAAGTAPDDLASKVMRLRDPQTGQGFSTEEMVDQVAIFFLAGHETSASALAWSLYLLATHPYWQDQAAAEAAKLPSDPQFSDLATLSICRDVFREALRLYPPVPMMVRETVCPETFRQRDLPVGTQVVISPWHLHRHTRLWDNPDGFDPARWTADSRTRCPKEAYLPFSKGSRVCPGAGFAMAEGPLLLALFLARFEVAARNTPTPVAHLTLRSEDGIRLWLSPRDANMSQG